VAEPKRRADEPHAFGAIFLIGDVGDIGHGRGHGGRKDAGEDARREQKGQIRGDGKKHVADHRAGEADEQNRPPTVAVGQTPPDRAENKLHQRKYGDHGGDGAADFIRTADKFFKIKGDDGDDQTKSEKIDKDDQKNCQQRVFVR